MTISRLRADIDRGKMRDKVAFPDPAAAPLGTDEEAAGNPLTKEQVAQARDYETRGAPDKPDGGIAIFAYVILALVLATGLLMMLAL